MRLVLKIIDPKALSMDIQKDSTKLDHSREKLQIAFAEHRSELLRHASLRMGTGDAGPDLVQDAFSKALLINDLSGVKNLRAYLFRIVTNLSIDHLRRAKLNLRLIKIEETESVLDTLSSPSPDPEQEIVDRERVRTLTKALQSLPEDSRQMFILFKAKGWKQKQIAKHFGVSLSTVEKKIKRAIQQCRNYLIK